MKNLFLIIFAFTTFICAQSPEEKAARELMIVSKSADMGIQMIDQLIEMQKQQNPSVGDEVWSSIRSEFNSDELINILVPIYVKNFTLAEMNEIIAFYKSPIGQKVIDKMPAVMQEAMLAGQQWGVTVLNKMTERLKEKEQK